MKENKVLYKVVTSNRESFNINHSESTKRGDLLREFGLVKRYEKGFVVKKTPYTPGIFCFDSFNAAEHFKWAYIDTKILKVKPIGKTKKPVRRLRVDYPQLREVETRLSLWKSKFITRLFNDARVSTYNIPLHTICCDAVEVLE